MKQHINFESMDRLKWIFLLLIAFTAVMFYFVINSSLETPFNMQTSTKAQVSSFVPQGWAFFTRDAREEKWYAYEKIKEGKFILRPPGSSYKYLFGINRLGRRLNYPILLASVDSLKWNNFYGNTDSLLKFSQESTPLSIKDEKLYLTPECKEVILIRMSIKPWAWSGFKNTKNNSKFLRLYVNCETK